MESATAASSAWDWTAGLHRVLCMQGGEDDVSYAKNSEGPACAITLCKPMLMSAIQSMNLDENKFYGSLRIADLGCATGYNTFSTVEMIVEALRRRYKTAEVEAFFCDLPSNDFNTLFRWMNEKQKGKRKFFGSGVGGSFYTRLFPRETLHVAVSLSALHWLSQIPERVLKNKGSEAWNKGRAWIEGANKEVIEAYAEQSKKDLDEFLRCRRDEMVKGGVLFMLMGGRPSGSDSQLLDDDSRDKHPFTTSMDQAWQDLLDEGLIDEETRDGFNIPAYMRTMEEVVTAVNRCVGFKIEKMEFMKIPEHSDEKQEVWKKDPVSYGQARANLVRATLRPIVEAYIGSYLSEQFFKRYETRVSSNTSLLYKTCFYGVVVVVATKV